MFIGHLKDAQYEAEQAASRQAPVNEAESISHGADMLMSKDNTHRAHSLLEPASRNVDDGIDIIEQAHTN